jgi:hypothetical protein
MDDAQVNLSQVNPAERILLLPHCLRRSEACKAAYNKEGLQCVKCSADCPVNLLREAALESGYKGICIAPGGRLAVNYVRQMQPRAIVAVACEKELEEGVQGVEELTRDNQMKPVIVIIPLIKDGCVDTEVDIEEALEIINTGCMETAGERPN